MAEAISWSVIFKRSQINVRATRINSCTAMDDFSSGGMDIAFLLGFTPLAGCRRGAGDMLSNRDGFTAGALASEPVISRMVPGDDK
jgi:hypothetical protein